MATTRPKQVRSSRGSNRKTAQPRAPKKAPKRRPERHRVDLKLLVSADIHALRMVAGIALLAALVVWLFLHPDSLPTILEAKALWETVKLLGR